jgi:histone H3/H4
MAAGDSPQPEVRSAGPTEAIVKAEELLKDVNPVPFSAAAFSVIKGKVSEYLKEVTTESAAIAKRSQSDVISVRDVEAACDLLTISPRKRLYKHVGTFAGLSLGFCGSTVGSMVVASSYPVWAVFVAIGSGLLGAFLLGVHINND